MKFLHTAQLGLQLLLAPFLKISLPMSILSNSAAVCKVVWPLKLTALGSALFSHNILALSNEPIYAALWRGVHPSNEDCVNILHPFLIHSCNSSVFFWRTNSCITVSPCCLSLLLINSYIFYCISGFILSFSRSSSGFIYFFLIFYFEFS